MNPVIEIIVSALGQTTLETHGFSGSACQDASRALEQALGIVRSERPTSEYFDATLPQRHQQNES